MKKFFVQIFLVFAFIKSYSQNKDSLIHALMINIASMQVKQDGEYYTGMFPGFRQNGGAPHNYQPDNNIFYTAVAAFSLRNMLPYLNNDDKKIAENIIANIQKIYPLFRNKHGYPYYGFWATNDPIMPHTYFYKYLKQIFGQGEDADDTVMVLMTDNSSKADVLTLKKRLEAVANRSSPKRKIISTYKKYNTIAAYSTYLGSRTAPDFDFAVQCNILYFVLDKKLPFAKQDSATLHLIIEMVRNREYMKTPVYLSPYYVRSSVLIYHVVRLMNAFNLPELNIYKQQLINDLKKIFDESTNDMDKLLASTSLMRLGDYSKQINFYDLNDFENSNQKQFIFFQARAAYSYPTPLKQMMLHFSYINYYFYCPAYYKILWLENLVLQNQRNTIPPNAGK